jgi:protein AATF/BFR2
LNPSNPQTLRTPPSLPTSPDFANRIQSWRDEILTKWSNKVHTAQGLPLTKKFKALKTSLTSQLRENLVDKPRLLARTHTKRAAFTRLGSTQELDEGKEIVDVEIFDDLDFYHMLLKDLVERKVVDVPTTAMGTGDWGTRQGKVGRKNEKDTRASKGRKLRYHEHEKIQNFMAPLQVGTWHEDQIEYPLTIDS